ncbi:protein FRA10AC1 homolog isoform X1 [Schistocerca gregaria]|uniref:protein FRA10AC1 homolog isoform X1 n=2 Tax=Schistocerca gregaria TaxID=7010 RepID=UPI00211E1A29|nr:protein FRA10AC1 homolog isoform X1 [Schistocerca gregaria]
MHPYNHGKLNLDLFCAMMDCMPQRKRSLMYIKSSLASLNPYDLHKKLINEYLLSRKGSTSLLRRDRSRDKCDSDVIRENHRFLWDDDDIPDSWEAQLAKKYYDKLFKEYCICDLSRYKENKVAMRWRTEQEVVVGKGQFSCGEKHCSSKEDLHTWEVNFGYIENGEKKNALVKARLCTMCSEKLNYKHKRREITRKKKRRLKGLPEIEPNKKLRKDEDDDRDVNQELNPEIKEEDESALWREAHQGTEEKTRDQEFEEYLEDLFM